MKEDLGSTCALPCLLVTVELDTMNIHVVASCIVHHLHALDSPMLIHDSMLHRITDESYNCVSTDVTAL